MPSDKSAIRGLAMEATPLVKAFEGALRELRLPDRSHPEALVVAKLIINFAKTGERDATRLQDLVVAAMRRIGQTPILDHDSTRLM
jgi:hypothetical protein